MNEGAVAETCHLLEGSFFGALVASLNEVVVDLDGMSSLFTELRTVRVVWQV